jgi:hypothetical protein
LTQTEPKTVPRLPSFELARAVVAFVIGSGRGPVVFGTSARLRPAARRRDLLALGGDFGVAHLRHDDVTRRTSRPRLGSPSCPKRTHQRQMAASSAPSGAPRTRIRLRRRASMSAPEGSLWPRKDGHWESRRGEEHVKRDDVDDHGRKHGQRKRDESPRDQKRPIEAFASPTRSSTSATRGRAVAVSCAFRASGIGGARWRR